MRIVFITGTRESRVTYPMRDAMLIAMAGAEVVYHGACKTGIDAFAASLALYELEVETIGIPARWRHEGDRAAGPRRNARMAERAAKLHAQGNEVICHAFPWRESKGTRGCIDVMRANGVPVVVHEIGKANAS